MIVNANRVYLENQETKVCLIFPLLPVSTTSHYFVWKIMARKVWEAQEL